ncbi:hypothetical protein OIE66_33020 [Nonomuraea sp. NBC_01738]|uniref:hypothetical protein n=1 Tax=Nonomuraea sp. NBC_01738 TaxID=2976003 RepID=UPI002E0FE83B|nr:hypothetical protein OIE66_33020 [Nonomuraea sp. NBC_01738]
MSIRKTLAALAIGGAGALTLLSVTPTGALADTAQAQAPSCVSVWQRTGWTTKTGYARNDCRYNVRVKIVWSWGTDGPCRTLSPGQTMSAKVARGQRNFEGVKNC